MKFGSEADRRMSQSVSVNHLSTSGWGGQEYKQRPQGKAVRAVRATDNPTEKPPSQTLKRTKHGSTRKAKPSVQKFKAILSQFHETQMGFQSF